MPEPTPVQFGSFRIPGSTYAFTPQDPEMAKAMFHPPGMHGTRVTMLGLQPRMIVIPFCLHSVTFRNEADILAFLKRMIDEKKKGRQQTLKVPINTTTDDYDHCTFEGFKPGQEWIKQDVSRGLGAMNSDVQRWFCDGELVFMQVQF